MSLALQIVALVCFVTLFFVYLGYPLVLVVLGWIAPRRELARDEGATPPVTLLISCFNEEEVLEAKLAQLRIAHIAKNRLAINAPRMRNRDQHRQRHRRGRDMNKGGRIVVARDAAPALGHQLAGKAVINGTGFPGIVAGAHADLLPASVGSVKG